MKLNVENMTCDHCKLTIEKALTNAGFSNVAVDLGKGSVSFDGDDVNLAKKTIEDSGYKVKK